MTPKVNAVHLVDLPEGYDDTQRVKMLADQLSDHEDLRVQLLAAISWLACDRLESLVSSAGPSVLRHMSVRDEDSSKKIGRLISRVEELDEILDIGDFEP